MIGFIEGYYGWLGNQMFQYAATWALAHRRGVRCVFPANTPDLHRAFRLTADRQDGPYGPAIRLYPEAHYHFDPAVLDLPDNTVLAGYFQSEKYFADCADDIRREFTLRESSWQPEARLENTVSVHVRRGDYCLLKEHHPMLGLDYYSRAMSMFPPATAFLVFSDEPDWCDQNMGGWPGVQVVQKRSAEADMDFMSRCAAGHIIANSSFSWWGAWLRDRPGKKVIAPLAWFGPAKADWDTRDLIPEGWERI